MGSQRKEGEAGLGDDSSGRMRVRFLFATERVVLFCGKWGRGGCSGGRGSEFLWGQSNKGLPNCTPIESCSGLRLESPVGRVVWRRVFGSNKRRRYDGS